MVGEIWQQRKDLNAVKEELGVWLKGGKERENGVG